MSWQNATAPELHFYQHNEEMLLINVRKCWYWTYVLNSHQHISLVLLQYQFLQYSIYMYHHHLSVLSSHFPLCFALDFLSSFLTPPFSLFHSSPSFPLPSHFSSFRCFLFSSLFPPLSPDNKFNFITFQFYFPSSWSCLRCFTIHFKVRVREPRWKKTQNERAGK